MPVIPESTKTSLAQRLRDRARQGWPQLAAVHVRYHGRFAYVTGELPDGEQLPLMRLRYGGSAHRWGVAIYVASKDKHEDQTGLTTTVEDAFDLVCRLYVGPITH
jgi:hypothetical protein